jgi:hypothetical protein
MFTGTLFSSSDPDLDAHVRELDERVALIFPEFADGRASAHLRLGRDEFSGRGVSLPPGYLPPAGKALAFYFGPVVDDSPSGEFVLDLPSFRVGGRTWHPSIDAAAVCRSPSPPAGNAALFNHTCHGATVVLRQPDELRNCRLSCVAAYPRTRCSRAAPCSGTTTGEPAVATGPSPWISLAAWSCARRVSILCGVPAAEPCPARGAAGSASSTHDDLPGARSGPSRVRSSPSRAGPGPPRHPSSPPAPAVAARRGRRCSPLLPDRGLCLLSPAPGRPRGPLARRPRRGPRPLRG